MAYANSFTELEVYQLCRQLAKEIFEISKTFPKEETYSLTDQVRRSSRSIGAQIDADGERAETVHWLINANDCAYVTDSVTQDLIDRYDSVHRMLKSMIEKSSSFCPN